MDRFDLYTYFVSLAAYFFGLTIPIAGLVFGTWLTITLIVFKAQHNEGFSSLRIQHWKNVLKCHVTPDGDLEVSERLSEEAPRKLFANTKKFATRVIQIFALGLDRSPKLWLKDKDWDFIYAIQVFSFVNLIPIHLLQNFVIL